MRNDARMFVTIDGIHGIIKIRCDQFLVEFKWCEFGEHVGFMSSFNDMPIILTEIAAEQYIRNIVNQMIIANQIKPGQLKITNHFGDNLPDVQFMPPTLKYNQEEIEEFTEKQHCLQRIWYHYEETNNLGEDCIFVCQEEGILDDFLKLLQSKILGLTSNLTITKE